MNAHAIKTCVYKTVDGTALRLDVHLPDAAARAPVVMWLHGGGMIFGRRDEVPQEMLDFCRAEGFALASIDYRLAPETKLPEIVQDVKDAYSWLRESGPDHGLDPDRILVAGGSAGGCLALMTGYAVQPRPCAILSYWGYGDVDGEWYTTPSPYYRTARPLVSIDQARAALAPGGKRPDYYLFLRQNGLWTREVTGMDPAVDPRRLDPFCPVRNVSRDFPPVFMVHGIDDEDVPHEKSAAMARELARHGVPHTLISIPNGRHGLAGGDKETIARARAGAHAFMREHLRRGS